MRALIPGLVAVSTACGPMAAPDRSAVDAGPSNDAFDVPTASDAAIEIPAGCPGEIVDCVARFLALKATCPTDGVGCFFQSDGTGENICYGNGVRAYSAGLVESELEVIRADGRLCYIAEIGLNAVTIIDSAANTVLSYTLDPVAETATYTCEGRSVAIPVFAVQPCGNIDFVTSSQCDAGTCIRP